MDNLFCRKVRYLKYQRNGFEKDCSFTCEFFISWPSDLIRPRYCRSVDARMRTQNDLLLTELFFASREQEGKLSTYPPSSNPFIATRDKNTKLDLITASKL